MKDTEIIVFFKKEMRKYVVIDFIFSVATDSLDY